jgi:hypothetical protein
VRKNRTPCSFTCIFFRTAINTKHNSGLGFITMHSHVAGRIQLSIPFTDKGPALVFYALFDYTLYLKKSGLE